MRRVEGQEHGEDAGKDGGELRDPERRIVGIKGTGSPLPGN
jgi:hypothetical protein